MTKETRAEVTKTTASVPQSYDYGTDAGKGFENTKGSDLSIPFILVLQSNSPQVENSNPAGAAAGKLLNSVTLELADGETGVPFLPCYREDKFIEWIPRTAGGGLVEMHAPESAIVKEAMGRAQSRFGKLRTTGGNDLVETHSVYGLTLTEDGERPTGFAVVSCSSTKIKPFRNWFTNMYMVAGRPPLFAHRAVIRTVKQKNSKGVFYNFEFRPLRGSTLASMIDPRTQTELLTAARQFREMVESGKARANFATQQAEHEREPGDDTAEVDASSNAPF